MRDRDKPISNSRLRSERERRSWTLQEVADHLFDLCVAEGRKSGINADIVGRWERGISRPTSHYRAKLCQLYSKTAEELGLIDEPVTSEPLPPASQNGQEEEFSSDISHIIGREDVVQKLLAYLETPPGKPRIKLSILYGITGAGKTSVLKLLCHRLAMQSRSDFSFYPFRQAQDKIPAEHLDNFLAALFSWLGVPQPDVPQLPSLHERISHVIKALKQRNTPLILVLDDLQVALEPDGTLTTGWQHFLQAFIEANHTSTLYAASRESLWHGRARVFVREMELELLSPDAGVQVWRNLGFAYEDKGLLQQATEKCGGNPGMIEIVARHVQQPIPSLEWDSASPKEETQEVRGLEEFLRDPHILSRHLAIDVFPLIDDIVRTQLSSEARDLLQVLALSPVPLAPALLPRLSPVPERAYADLRRTTLLSRDHVRLFLPSLVVESVRQQLTDDQIARIEHRLIDVYPFWIEQGTFLTDDEQGTVVAELAVLCFKHRRLLEATEHLIYYGWLSFNLGHGPRLARHAEQAIQHCHWQESLSTTCAVLLIQEMLSPFLGETTDDLWRAQEEHIRHIYLTQTLQLPPGAEHYLTHLLLLHAMTNAHFDIAQAIVDTYALYLEQRHIPQLDQFPSLLNERAFLFWTWSEYLDGQGQKEQARDLRERAIILYRTYSLILSQSEQAVSPLTRSLHQRAVAYCLNHLGYALGRQKLYEEALAVIDRSIALKEQGYTYISGLAAAYSDKSHLLMELGRYQEALDFANRASANIQRLADTGDALSQQEAWVHQVNRGQLLLRLGNIEEAEPLLREARLHLRAERSMYRVFTQQALDEIDQWRQCTTAPIYQLDWCWIGRFRELVAYDGHGWLVPAGPFTDQEQRQWDRLFQSQADEATRDQLAALMVRSRERELEAAIAEQREPRLRYPAIASEDVRRRIGGLLQLDKEIEQHEPNAVVRRLYHGAIEDDLTFLRLIEATAEEDTEAYWEWNLRLFSLPTPEEVESALIPIKREILQGLAQAKTRVFAQQLSEFMQHHLHLSLDLLPNAAEEQEASLHERPASPQPIISVQAAKRFFETALQEGACDGWKVEIDPKFPEPRVEGGLRTLFLPDRPCRLDEVRYWVIHELVGHIGRNVAGERSRLGLLGISTKHYQPTEEGLNAYHERQIAALRGERTNEPEVWIGTITTGLASGVITSPQAFQSLRAFFEGYGLLHQASRYAEVDIQAAREQMREYASHLCLRVFRGVPDLEQAGVCYLQDAMYLRGIWMIERAVAEDETVLDRLAVGKVSLEVLPDLQELGITSAPQPLRQLAYDPDLDARILSFERREEPNRL